MFESRFESEVKIVSRYIIYIFNHFTSNIYTVSLFIFLLILFTIFRQKAFYFS